MGCAHMPIRLARMLQKRAPGKRQICARRNKCCKTYRFCNGGGVGPKQFRDGLISLTMKNKTVSETAFPWLRANLGKHCLGCLTGYSGPAVLASVMVIRAYSSSDQSHEFPLLTAYEAIVSTLDAPERHLCYHLIAHVLNWSDREVIWDKAGLSPLQHVARCLHE